MKLKTWIVVMVMGVTAMMVMPAESEVPSNCDWLIEINEACIKEAKCAEGGNAINIWEDCAVGSKLFTINDTDVSIECEIVDVSEESSDVFLKTQLDIEASRLENCDSSLLERLYFRLENINEFKPYPTKDSVPTTEVSIFENSDPKVVTNIYYTDEDYGETKSLTCELVSSDTGHFSLTPNYDSAENIMMFEFAVQDALDFEAQVFFKVEYDIISIDDRGKILSSRQTFFINVKDMPDNPPFWTEIVPVYTLSECKENGVIFKVTAQDRDVGVDYAIKYSMLEGDGTGDQHFSVNNETGEVSKTAEIDREDLLENEISSFRLLITATEYIDEDTVGAGNNSVSQGTTVIIEDCNNKQPTFDKKEYTVEMNEITSESGDQSLNVRIIVTDMDEGSNGSFTLKTSWPEYLWITPEGKLSQDVELKALYKKEDNIFDFDNHDGSPIEFTITVTEDKDTTHVDTANVKINLLDVNDNKPKFKVQSYGTSVEETSLEGIVLLTVEADDDDGSDKFGKESIRYTLEPTCQQLNIDESMGYVWLNMKQDYEDKNTPNQITCKVYARDNFGTGLQGTSEIVVDVMDVNDETPQMQQSPVTMKVKEGSGKDIVDSFIVSDADATAVITASIEASACSGQFSKPLDVDDWFVVEMGDANPPDYAVNVKVNGDLDREACSEVTLSVMATDTDMEINTDNVNGTVIITIEDKADEPPQFVGSYEDVSFYEFDGNNPPQESVFVFEVTVSDPDSEDTIKLSITKGDDKLELPEDEVNVKEGEERKVEVRTKKGAMIDRETQDTLEVIIELKNPSGEKTNKKFTIKILDLNDNKPIMDTTFCNIDFPIYEEDESRSINGTVIHTVKATDADSESPYNSVSYFMLNDQVPDNKGLRTPFTVNPSTGEVSILLTDKKMLDRETDQSWELLFSAFDKCRQTGDPGCTVQTSDEPCLITITVLDINDNSPHSISNIPEGDIKVDDFLKKDEDLGYQLKAEDDDIGINALINYTVIATYLEWGDDEDMDLFYAENESAESSTCRLYANTNFQGQSLTGVYTVVLEAMDGGGRSTDFNITVDVKDANDQTPYLEFSGCSGEAEDNIIRMQENVYTPGEDGRPKPMKVNCQSPDGPPFFILVRDDDLLDVNRRSTLKIDAKNSSVENAENEEEQLKYWSVEPCGAYCYNLMLSHKIDREKGNTYNLKLHVENEEETHKQESWRDLKVIIASMNEDDPRFCEEPPTCSQVVYIYENEPDAKIVFKEAVDPDNDGCSEDECEKIFYSFIGGDVNYFQLVNNMQTTIMLKNKPDGLDREDRGEYSLVIFSSNDEAGGSLTPNIKHNILELQIIVGDKNDEDPFFGDDVIFTSFMSSNKNGDPLTTIEAGDYDLNETLTYTILDDIKWFDSEFTPNTSFKLQRNTPRSVILQLDLDPKGMSEGYCNFTIRVEDAVGHRDETQVKIYIINEDYQVRMFFLNTLEDVKDKENEIEDAFTEAYKYTCVIDSITPTQNTRNNENRTTVYMHFIDNEQNEPVNDKTILDLSDNADIMRELYRQLEMININLDSNNRYLPDDSNSLEDEILMLQILLGVVALVLGALLVLLFTVYTIRTRSLTRKVKVLSTNTFGSKASGLNEMGDDMTNVPGSNLAKTHGNHNPIFNEDNAFKMAKRDTGSISSGDSIFVGVEDNPEFRNYIAKGVSANHHQQQEQEQSQSMRGAHEDFFTPQPTRPIDDVPSSVPGVQGGVKGNPLLNLGSVDDAVTDVSNDSLRLPSFDDASQTDSENVNQQINSNFSFL